MTSFIRFINFNGTRLILNARYWTRGLIPCEVPSRKNETTENEYVQIIFASKQSVKLCLRVFTWYGSDTDTTSITIPVNAESAFLVFSIFSCFVNAIDVPDAGTNLTVS